jgi:hypothetical protein
MPASADAVQRLRKLISDYFLPRALYAATSLDVAECLAGGPMTADEIAERVGAHGPSLYRVLRALATAEVFQEDEHGRFVNTPLSELLRGGVPDSLRDLVLLFGDETSWRAWEALPHTLRTGQAGFEHVYGERFFDYLSRHPDAAAMFDRAMASASSMVNGAIVEAYDFSGLATLIDVAGGTGSTLCAILESNRTLRGIVFDLPHVADRARRHIAARNLGGRCAFEAGSFFDALPAGADLYFMKHILHDWGDEECLGILRNCRAAMRQGARLLVCERIVPPGNEPSPTKLIDLHMLAINHGGKERTELEYRRLLAATGFACERVIATRSAWSLVEGVAL